MKKLYIAIVLALVSVCAAAQDGKGIYKKYSDESGVSAVYISPAMFRMMGRLPDMNISNGKVNLGPIIKSLNGLYVLDSSNPKVNETLARDAENFVKSGRYELLMEAKDDGETVHIYTCGDADTVTGLILLAKEANSCSFICLDGNMLRSQMEEMLSSAARN